jgi:hypothetical protein
MTPLHQTEISANVAGSPEAFEIIDCRCEGTSAGTIASAASTLAYSVSAGCHSARRCIKGRDQDQ